MAKQDEHKKRIEEMREFTKGKMPLILLASTEEDYKGLKKAKSRMRNVSNLEIIRKEDYDENNRKVLTEMKGENP